MAMKIKKYSKKNQQRYQCEILTLGEIKDI